MISASPATRTPPRPYAAPEQWRDERVTSAADVYALGIICHELLSGVRPFDGPDFREQHLHQDPPGLIGVPPSLDALVLQCLAKVPGARPSPQDLSQRLSKLQTGRTTSSGLAALREANRSQVSLHSHEGTQQSRERSAAETRAHLVSSAKRQLEAICDEVLGAIASEIDARVESINADPLIAVSRAIGEANKALGKQIRLGRATLAISRSQESPLAYGEPWNLRGDRPPLDLVASSGISLQQPVNPEGFAGRAHSLWYCDAVKLGEYAWYETAFIESQYVSNPAAPFPPEGADLKDLQGRFLGHYAPLSLNVREMSSRR